MESCKFCGEPVNGDYCSDCGQSVKIKKIDRRYLFNEIADVLNLNRRMFYTIKQLLINPGNSIRHYITEDRSRFVKPISFVFINSLIFTLVLLISPIDINVYIQEMADLETTQSEVTFLINKWVFENSGYVTLITGLFTAFGIKLFFRKAGYNLYEIFTLLCFMSGLLLLVESLFILFQSVTQWNLLRIMFVIEPLFITWTVGQFFDGKKAMSYIKALLSYLFGFLALTLFLIIVFNLISMTINN